MRRWALKGQLCRCQDTVFSQMGMLRLMHDGCGAWICVRQVASDRLRLEAWGLNVCMSEQSLTQSSCGYSMRVLGDSDRGRVN